MSWRALKAAWAAPLSPPSLKLSVVYLADLCDDAGGKLFPSLENVGRAVGVSRDQAKRLMRTLSDMGLVSVLANASGGKPGTTKHLLLNIEKLKQMAETGCMDAPGTEGADAPPTGGTGAPGTGGMGAAEGGHTGPETGCMDAPLSTIYPPKNHDASDDATSASAHHASSMSAKDRVWSLGPELLGEKSRGLLGKLVKQHGEAIVAAALADCEREKPGEPKSWVSAACANRQQGPKSGAGGENDMLSNPTPAWATLAGFGSRFEAENAGCTERNHRQFSNGKKVAA